MKTATVRELRNQFALVSRWIEEGEEVKITKRGRVFARIIPEPPASLGSRKVPDFARRVRRIFGKTRLTPQQSRELREYWKGDR
jgi:antitoxin (DNA-binding transcriptional repressor) of toxin-antitoxin stability system